jgi:hypothetical protein
MPDDLLRKAAQRASRRPHFLAAVLRAYQELQGMDEKQLADELDCRPADLPRLGLCRRPTSEPGAFRQDVERIAASCGVSALALARLVRTVDAAQALGPSPFLAARDHEPE